MADNLKRETKYPSDTLVPTYQTTRCHILEGSNPNVLLFALAWRQYAQGSPSNTSVSKYKTVRRHISSCDDTLMWHGAVLQVPVVERIGTPAERHIRPPSTPAQPVSIDNPQRCSCVQIVLK
jgi:hypothetical protein